MEEDRGTWVNSDSNSKSRTLTIINSKKESKNERGLFREVNKMIHIMEKIKTI